jgi:hypothetical protein
MGCTSGGNVKTAAVAAAADDDFYCDYCSLNFLNTYYQHLQQRI